MKNWEFFYKQMIEHRNRARTHPELIETRGEPESVFSDGLMEHFEGAKVFAVNDDVHELLLKTDGTSDIKGLPFDKFFIECSFDVEDLKEKQFGFGVDKVHGILVTKVDYMVMVDHNTHKTYRAPKDAVRIYVLTTDVGYPAVPTGYEYMKGYSFNTINVVAKDWTLDFLGQKWEAKVDTNIPKIRKLILNYVSNFLNLLNNPNREVVVTEREYSQARNKRRERQGILKVPNTQVVIPVGTLKQYIQQLHEHRAFSYSHKFFVRGHWRVLRHPKYGENIGKKIWLKPFLKGSGILVPKTYEVDLK